jgi:hypothetical protein
MFLFLSLLLQHTSNQPSDEVFCPLELLAIAASDIVPSLRGREVQVDNKCWDIRDEMAFLSFSLPRSL